MTYFFFQIFLQVDFIIKNFALQAVQSSITNFKALNFEGFKIIVFYFILSTNILDLSSNLFIESTVGLLLRKIRDHKYKNIFGRLLNFK